MPHIRGLALYIFIFISLSNVYSQKLDHVLGEVLVVVKDGMKMDLDLKETAQRSSNGAKPKFVKIMSEPLEVWLVKVDPNVVNENNFRGELARNKNFRYVGKNRLITPRRIPNDPQIGKQWQYLNNGLNGAVAGADMNMYPAWDIATGGVTPAGDTIVVCVIDDGINLLHEDISQNLWSNKHEIPNNGVDDDSNGYIDDVKGWNIDGLNDNIGVGGGHGTPVAGIIGAKGNNEKGVSGVNWDVKMMIINYGFASEANAIAAYSYPYIMRKMYNQTKGVKGAFVVATNASWGIDKTFAEEAPLWCSLYDSLGAVGILNCGATSNSNNNVDEEGDLPTSCQSEYLISVTNLANTDIKQNSGYGRRSIDLGAYGHQTFTTSISAYATFGGTSAATPHVTGLVGLMYAASCTQLSEITKTNPRHAALIVKDMLLNGTKPNTSLKNITTTGGSIDAFKAMSNIMTLCGACAIPAGVEIWSDEDDLVLQWSNNTGQSKIQVRYRRPETETWTVMENVHTGDVIQNLGYCTEYEIQIGSNCGTSVVEFGYSKFISTGGCCPKPSPITIATYEDEIQLEWDFMDQTEHIVQLKRSGEQWEEYRISEDTFTLSDLSTCQGYTFRIQSICNIYQNISDFSPELDASTSCGACTEYDYCQFSKKDNSGEWINSFTLDELTSVSGASSTGYRSYIGQNTTTLQQGQSYSFEINVGYSGSKYSDYYMIWIDLNQDGIWDKNEAMFQSPEPIRDKVTGTILIPESAILGSTRLRLIQSYDFFEGGCDSDEFIYGEVEDYCITIVLNSCINQTELVLGDFDKDEAKIKIINNTQRDSIYFEYKEKDKDTWANILLLDTIQLKGLTLCTNYAYRYKNKCGDQYSNFSEIQYFKTDCSNNVIDQSKNEWMIFPNPFHNSLTIRSINNVYNISEISLISSDGKMIKPISSTIQSNQIELKLNDISPGLYFIELKQKDGNSTFFKVINI